MTRRDGPLRRLAGTLAGGWHDAGSVARRITAPLRRAARRAPKPGAPARSARRRHR